LVVGSSAATSLFKILLKYRPEDKAEKKERLLKRAQAEAEGKTVETKKPINVKFGLKHVTWLIEQVVTFVLLLYDLSFSLVLFLLILRNDLLSYLLLTEQSPACCDCS
jgi:ribosomal protein L7Ae-like RNA K-turn-binding protein